MRTILVHLRLATASHRKRLLGIFSHFGPTSDWNIRLVPDENRLCALMRGDNASRPDGIISGVPYAPDTLKLIARLGIPFVGIGMSGNELACAPHAAAFVMNDNGGIGKAAADYFLQLGDFRSYAFVADTQTRAWSAERQSGFARRLRASEKHCRVFAPPPGSETDAGLEKFLAAMPKPGAVLAAWDGRGADVLNAARRIGVRVPDELAVLGVDDDTLICEHTLPMLSSVRTDAEGMGAAAARLMAALVAHRPGKTTAATTCAVLGVVERGSTHAPAPAADLIRRANDFIAREATRGIHADDVARHLKVSRRLLDLRFNQFEPFSVSETIARRRIDEARRLLCETSKPVKEVFRLVSFNNIPNAHRLFKDATGLSPNAWRKASRPIRQGQAKTSSREPQFETVKDLSPEDAQSLRGLIAQLDPSAAFDPERLRAALASGVTTLHAVRLAGRLVGAAATVRFSTPTGTHYRIEDVVVDARVRGRHLGRRLMEYVLERLKAQGAQSVELTSRPARTTANALYRKLRFLPRKTNVYARAL